MKKSLKSIELHLKYEPGEVVETKELIDVACGIYPCYYVIKKDSLIVSTSATELIFHIGDFNENKRFDPPNFLQEETMLDRVHHALPSRVTEFVPSKLASMLRSTDFMTSTHWYEESHTIDKRINKLNAFEKVSVDGIINQFNPTYSITDSNELIEKSANHIQSFINRVERQWPNHHHVARVGGMDSQLILLAEKSSENWSVFSAQPNTKIVTEFIEKNDIMVKNIFTHNNKNREEISETKRKLICSDLRSNPRHLRWYPKLKNIVERFDGNVIFWIGTEGDTIYSYHSDYHSVDKETYFDLHRNRAANWQGITHQVTKNFTGAAAISPYHSEKIWDELYRHYSPEIIAKGDELRYKLGERLAGKNIEWIERNPGPTPYKYETTLDADDVYRSYIKGVLNGTAKSMI